MTAVHVDGEDFVVEAEELSRAFGVDPPEVIRWLREGILTSRCERGIGEHEGCHRLIFSHERRVLRLTVGDDGRVLSRAFFTRPPARAGKPGLRRP